MENKKRLIRLGAVALLGAAVAFGPAALEAKAEDLVAAQRGLLLDPNDPEVIAGARENGMGDDVIASAQRSPVYRWVIEWGLALPLHAEHRTLPG